MKQSFEVRYRATAWRLPLGAIVASMLAATCVPAHAVVCDAFQDKAEKIFSDITNAVSDVGDIMASGGITEDPARDRRACQRARSAVAEADRGKNALDAERSKCSKDWERYNAHILEAEKTLKGMEGLACK